MAITLVIYKKYTCYKIKFAHFYLYTICCKKLMEIFEGA